MPKKRHDDLFKDIASFRSLYFAAQRAAAGKRRKPGAATFMVSLEREILALERSLKSKKYKPGRYRSFEVYAPNKRIVSAAPFRDRVIHHALHAVVQPIFERGFIGNTFSNRVGKGTHAAVRAYEHYRNRHAHVLRCDIFRYFPAIDHDVLKSMFRRRIACEQTLWLMDLIVDASNEQEAVNVLFPGDDPSTPYGRRRGLPIGNLTSQFFANLYLDAFDHFATEVLQAPYVRYVDDFALFHDDPAVLEDWRGRIEKFLERPRLKLHPIKTRIVPTSEPAEFLGFVLMANGQRRLPEENVRRFRNRLRGLRDQWRAGTIAPKVIEQRIGSWIAHAEHAHTRSLRHAIFKDGFFDPFLKPGRPLAPRRPRRLLEQQSEEPPVCEPQQERTRELEWVSRLPPRQYA